MDSQDAHFWKEVVQDELDSIMKNNTWVLVNLAWDVDLLHQSGSLKRKREIL